LVTGSGAVFGSAIGAPISGYITKKFGRKGPCIATILPYAVGWALIAIPCNFWMMYAGRFLVGLTQGVRAPISRMYLAEVSHPSHRQGGFAETCTALHENS
jgi:MFS family permease